MISEKALLGREPHGPIALIVCLLLPAGAVLAEAPGSDSLSSGVLRRADRLYEEGKFPAAAELYARLLPGAAAPERRHCFERLLGIYARAGRLDQAIRTGLDYAGWLRRVGDWPRARGLDLELGEWYLALGHYRRAEACLRQVLGDLPGPPASPGERVRALTYLALAAERQGDRDRAGQRWRQVEALARARLEDRRQRLDPGERLQCLQGLSESARFLGRQAEAIAALKQVLLLQDPRKDPAARRDTLRLLAGRMAAIPEGLAEAEQCLTEALELHQRCAASDRLTEGDLACDLADVAERRQKDPAAWLRQAEKDYRAVLEEGAARAEGSTALAAFWRLQRLYQRTSDYEQALRLTGEAERWGANLLIGYRLKAEEGTLEVLRGEFRRSGPLLAEAVAAMDKQSPPNLIELPRALLNLAVVELVTNRRARAEELGKHCVQLYEESGLPEDLVLVDADNLLGTCAAQDGDYREAIRRFRAGVERCQRLGPPADRPRCNLLLNIALLYKAQGELKEALAACDEARTYYGRFAAPDSAGLMALDAARASLLAGQGQLDPETYALAGRVLKWCADHRLGDGHPLALTAKHCQALVHLFRREYAEAEAVWEEVARLQGDQSPLRPRTLNYLALARECRGDFVKAQELYQDARRLEAASPRAFPATQFTTLWRLANVLDRQGRRAEARACLGEAAAVVEGARLRTYGDDRQRASYFAQFEPGFEELVEWGVRDGNVLGALAAAARARSRTLQDQLLRAGVDPCRNLPPRDAGLRDRSEALRRKIADLRAQAQLVPADQWQGAEAQGLLAQFEQAQKDYADVYHEILSASPVYQYLAAPDFAGTLTALREKILRPGPGGTAAPLLLVYHVGRERSYLFLLGERSEEAFPLTVPAELAERAAAPPPRSLAEALPRSRGVVRHREAGPPPPPALPISGESVPLGREALAALVGNYLDSITDPEFQATRGRGLRLKSRDAARPLPAQRPELLADILLPDPVRERIRALAPACLIVVPDGALHKLPLEALVFRAADGPSGEPTYLLDDPAMPPLVYAPSVAILKLLAYRPPPGLGGPLTLLTVADPVYPSAAPANRKANPVRQDELLALVGKLPPLPGTRRESEGISRLFEHNRVTALHGGRATKQALLTHLGGQRIIHIAAHGFADERFDNRFGALALTPGKAGPDDDGFLTLPEIYTLRLPDCELAVLSACVTDVGPQPPLEAGITLAGGFLAAGARRVVASHWSADDDATSELMQEFFRELTAAARDGKPLSYPRALREAQRKVRAHPRSSAPFYWAPFVLIGPPS